MSGLALVAVAPAPRRAPRVRVPLLPGDRIVASAGASVVAGRPARGARAGAAARRDRRRRRRGARRTRARGSPRSPARRGTAPAGELLFEHGGRRRIATGPHPDLVDARRPPGRVVAIHPGVEIVLQLDGIGIPGAELLGDPGHGRLALLPGDGDGRIPLEVAHAGAIVVFPGRADAETLTRARAMGIAGAVVAGPRRARPARRRRVRGSPAGRAPPSRPVPRAGPRRLPAPLARRTRCARSSPASPDRRSGLVGGPADARDATVAPGDLPRPDPRPGARAGRPRGGSRGPLRGPRRAAPPGRRDRGRDRAGSTSTTGARWSWRSAISSASPDVRARRRLRAGRPAPRALRVGSCRDRAPRRRPADQPLARRHPRHRGAPRCRGARRAT